MADQAGDRKEPGLGLRFVAEVDLADGTKLGAWQKVEGLSVEYEIHEYKEGGVNDYIHRLPTRAKYVNVKLTRPVGKESHLITDWLISFSQQVSRKTACISAMTADGTVVASWSLDGVMPVRWSGPSLNLDSPKVAMETLELAHHGFLPASGVGR